MLYPDAQLEYIAADGRTGRVNIEVASGHYRDKSIHAKSKAGFTLHATRGNRLRVLKALNAVGGGKEGRRDPGACNPAVKGWWNCRR